MIDTVEDVFKTPKDWVTFATQYKRETIGTASIITGHYRPGFYLMEGIKGYVVWYNEHTLHYTSLNINGKQWMLDDPLHWIGMQELAKSTSGSVLVAGLGLGLVASQLIQNPKVTEIVVIERNSDVIKLIGKYLQSPKISIINTDFEQYLVGIQGKIFDYAILDLWVADDESTKEEREIIRNEMKTLTALCVNKLKSKVYIWGINDKIFNPAFEDSERLQKLKQEMIEEGDENE